MYAAKCVTTGLKPPDTVYKIWNFDEGLQYILSQPIDLMFKNLMEW